MTDYTKTQSYTPKDSLATGDPEKLILGSDFDAELDLIVTAIASKYDSSDIATQAQAEAGVNNVTIMTPLRVAQLLNGAFGGSGAGMLGDIAALADPNADRILFWDDSAGAVAMLAASTGLTITGTNITTNDSQIVHNSLSGYDANRHIDHTAVSITPSGGITGGGTIAASRTLTLDITSLTVDGSPDTAADYMLTYDASAVANKKVLLSTLLGNALGDGSWYLSAIQSFSAGVEATLICNTAEYNSLQRGTYSTSTGIYTAGATATRVTIAAFASSTSHGVGASFGLNIYQNSTLKYSTTNRNDANAVAESLAVGGVINLNLNAADTVTIKIVSSSAASAVATYTRLSITELA